MTLPVVLIAALMQLPAIAETKPHRIVACTHKGCNTVLLGVNPPLELKGAKK